MVNTTNQTIVNNIGLCPTCGVESEFVVRSFRWNVVNADATESAVIVRMYECKHCGMVLPTNGLLLPKNGKHHDDKHEIHE